MQKIISELRFQDADNKKISSDIWYMFYFPICSYMHTITQNISGSSNPQSELSYAFFIIR